MLAMASTLRGRARRVGPIPRGGSRELYRLVHAALVSWDVADLSLILKKDISPDDMRHSVWAPCRRE